MARGAYNASVKKFVSDWDTNQFMDIMCNGAALNRIGGSVSEKKSWEANASKIRSLISLSHLPDDTEVAFEYKCPLSGRIDCMLFGYGKDNKKHIVHIEMKRASGSHYGAPKVRSHMGHGDVRSKKVIRMEDLEGFSDDLIETVKMILSR